MLTFEILSAELTQSLAERSNTPPETTARCTLGRDKVMVLVEYPLDSANAEPFASQTLDWLEDQLRHQFDTTGLPEEAADLAGIDSEISVQMFLKHVSESKPFTMRSFIWKVDDAFDDLFGEPLTIAQSAAQAAQSVAQTTAQANPQGNSQSSFLETYRAEVSSAPTSAWAETPRNVAPNPIRKETRYETPVFHRADEDTGFVDFTLATKSADSAADLATPPQAQPDAAHSEPNHSDFLEMPTPPYFQDEELVPSELDDEHLQLDLEPDFELDRELDSRFGLGADLDLYDEAYGETSLDADLAMGMSIDELLVEPNSDFNLPGEPLELDSDEFNLPTLEMPGTRVANIQSADADFFNLEGNAATRPIDPFGLELDVDLDSAVPREEGHRLDYAFEDLELEDLELEDPDSERIEQARNELSNVQFNEYENASIPSVEAYPAIEAYPTLEDEPNRPVESEFIESEFVESEFLESAPVETEFAESEPVESGLVEREPVESELVESERIEAELIQSEFGQFEFNEAAIADSIELEPVDFETAGFESAESESFPSDLDELDSLEAEPFEADAIDSEFDEAESSESELAEPEFAEFEPFEAEAFEADLEEFESVGFDPFEAIASQPEPDELDPFASEFAEFESAESELDESELDESEQFDFEPTEEDIAASYAARAEAAKEEVIAKRQNHAREDNSPYENREGEASDAESYADAYEREDYEREDYEDENDEDEDYEDENDERDDYGDADYADELYEDDPAYYLEGEGEDVEDISFEDVALVDDTEVQRQRELWQQQSKPNPWIFAGAFGFVLVGVLGYGLTRPCTFGQCDRLQTAQADSEEALRNLRVDSSAKAVTASQQQLKRSIGLLAPIPVWSSYYGQAQAVLPSYEAQVQALDWVSEAQTTAYAAAVASQNPPHPASQWQMIADSWQKAAQLLERVPTDSPVRDLVNSKLVEYRANRATILVRIDAESRAEVSLRQAQQAASLGTKQSESAASVETWEEALASWSLAVDQLSQIPNGTYAHGEAQKLLPEYLKKLDEVRDRAEQEIGASRLLSEVKELASAAQKAQSEQAWSVSLQKWKSAVSQLQTIPPKTLAHREAQTMQNRYAIALNQADNNFQVALRFQPIEPNFFAACGLEGGQKCAYSIKGGSVRLDLTQGYDTVINHSITPPNERSGESPDSELVAEANQLLQDLTLLSTQAKVPLELYDAKGDFLALYRPDLSGFTRQLQQASAVQMPQATTTPQGQSVPPAQSASTAQVQQASAAQ